MNEPVLWQGEIIGEPASKSNSRQIVMNRKTKVPMVIKSKKARLYEEYFGMQVRRPLFPIEGELEVVFRVWYGSRRPDLDVALLCDCLQRCGIIKNDRQIRAMHIYGDVDKENPRALITIFRK